ncbi:MAG: hypothetical protein JWO36_6346 [Myxococcales bacterium]|nr:hypothetical protein [Myxococcales bacterium]
MRTLLLIVLVVGFGARVAAARPVCCQVAYGDPEPDSEASPTTWRGPENAARFEWSTWFRLGWGVISERPGFIARGTITPTTDQNTTWETGLGAEVSVPIGGTGLRIGPWMELRGLDAFVGGEVVITRSPASFDLFQYDGEGVWIARAGGGEQHATASLSWGYRCPWKLWGPYHHGSRYEIGARLVVNATRAYRDPADWSATFGVEFEPVGALRYLLGIRSWY